MKYMYLLLLLTMTSIPAMAGTYICNSSDFDPNSFDGQSLTVEVSGRTIVSIKKNEGSWFCDSGEVAQPAILDESSDYTVYEAEFGCDEWNGRLVIGNSSNLTSASYSFTFADDERNRNIKSELVCKASK